MTQHPTRVGGPGDFAHELTHNMRGDGVLYIFNDNIADRDSNHQGGGNATARPFASVVDHMYPRAAGVCTGTAGGSQENGFSKLTAEVCAIIDADIAGIDAMLTTGRYHTVVYSAEDNSRVAYWCQHF